MQFDTASQNNKEINTEELITQFMSERKTIYLCLAHMSEEGWEQKYVKEAFDTNWVVPMGPNVNAFEEDLRMFVTSNAVSANVNFRITA